MTSSPVSLRSAPIRPSASARSADRAPTEAELLRIARTIAAAEGWEVDAPTCQVRGEPPRELRVAVSGGRLPGRCLLRVREPSPGAPPRRAEMEARVAAASEHVAGVVAALPHRRVRGRDVDAVVLAYPEHGDLDRLLAQRRGVRSGEAATILLGVAGGLEALHTSGWAGPGLASSDIVFLGDGCPALDAFDDVEPWTPDAAVTDAERFYALARTICLKVVDGSGMRLLAAVEAGLRRGSWSALAESVLLVIAPEPVALEPASVEPVASADGGADGKRRTGGRASQLVVWLARVMDRLDGRPGRALGDRVRTTLQRRPAVAAAAAVPVVLAIAFVALLPAPGPTSESALESASGKSRGAPTSAATEQGDAIEVTGAAASPSRTAATPTLPPGSTPEPTPVSSEVSPAAVAADPSAAAGAVGGGLASDDPVDAARAVLDARHSCFTTRPSQPDCLSALLDAGSPAVAEETAALGAKGAAADRDYRGAQLSLVERWGGAALVSAAPDSARTPESEPASLLLVRSEAGWRLRAVYP
ncbi:hypothetical protein [Leifsonia sp. 1010]|uniref:hypothetical protein n=1 Tax=Leifsonia sp. 1010 TaxID=2817769 RepID=UPI002861A55C|nr:hypothetical protein [Leifsonia sp. 1010]MDR6613581.1 hypothetical protein [Leifsonia sp. 1010]